MRASNRRKLVFLLGVGLILALSACMGHWFTPKQVPTLIIGNPQIFGLKGEVIMSVANMPQGGLASIAIANLGITYNNLSIVPASITATGLNGFRVLAQDFITTPGKGRLVAANAPSGLGSGTILKITFRVAGPGATFGVLPADKGKVTLGSDHNTLTTNWTLGMGKAYYAK